MPTKTRRKESTEPGMLREEIALRRIIAKEQATRLKANLSTYRAARIDRKNRDWMPPASASANLAIIPDSLSLNARARQMVRDSWMAKSAVRAIARNVVGRGIVPVPNAHDAQGNELTALNKAAEKEFWKWASRGVFCDTSRTQTFWQKQLMILEEYATVGESFVVWNYSQNDSACGLRLLDIPSRS